ncbi:MAG: ribosome maturation factor RimM [Candidatus Gastranaerophilales bacterium]|nr:ribosome maturation factor RimM [Candidatus Gastranaerophilales bacterium]
MSNDFVSIGKVLNFHGINGEFKVGYTNSKENQLKSLKTIYVKKDDRFSPLTVSNIRFHKGNAIIKFKEISSIDEVLEYKGGSLYTTIENVRKNLNEEEYLVDDLLNTEAYTTDGKYIGVVKYINQQPSSDLLTVKSPEGKEYLIPFVKDLVPELDLKNNKIFINAIEGLID